MKKTIYTIIGISLLTVMSCGPSAEQKAAAEKAKMDSVAKATAAAEKAKMDSVAKATADNIQQKQDAQAAEEMEAEL